MAKDVLECLLVYSINHSLKILKLFQETFGYITNFDNVTDFFALIGLMGDEHLDHSSSEQVTDYFDDYFNLSDEDNDDSLH